MREQYICAVERRAADTDDPNTDNRPDAEPERQIVRESVGWDIEELDDRSGTVLGDRLDAVYSGFH